jgi:NAD(P)-dependent dehydrogenase (short-subunit alcohol dehydrogenase family)
LALLQSRENAVKGRQDKMAYKDRVAIVTGAAGKGMGRSIALTLAREGARVIVNYLTGKDRAQAIVEHITGRGGRAAAFGADITAGDQCRALVDFATSQVGAVDICVIGPGAGWHPESIDKLDSAGALDDVLKEVAPVYHFLPLVLPGMYERRWGRVIAISLCAAGNSPAYAYNVAKAARTEALLLARDSTVGHDVTLNVIGPGPVPAIESLAEAVEQCAHGPAWGNRTTASAQDIAEGVAFLCSESANFISGTVLSYTYR